MALSNNSNSSSSSNSNNNKSSSRPPLTPQTPCIQCTNRWVRFSHNLICHLRRPTNTKPDSMLDDNSSSGCYQIPSGFVVSNPGCDFQSWDFPPCFPLSVYLSTHATRPIIRVHVLFPLPRLPPDVDHEMQSSHLITADPEGEDMFPSQSRQSSTTPRSITLKYPLTNDDDLFCMALASVPGRPLFLSATITPGRAAPRVSSARSYFCGTHINSVCPPHSRTPKHEPTSSWKGSRAALL